MKPEWTSRAVLLSALDDMRERVAAGVTDGGFIHYRPADPGDPPDGYRVTGSWHRGGHETRSLGMPE